MSSEEEEGSTSPVLPKDSDRGSSVSSDLQDEYDELLRYAVVTPKFEPSVLGQSQHSSQPPADGRVSSSTDDDLSQHSAGAASEQEESQHESSFVRQLRTPGLATTGAAADTPTVAERLDVQDVPARFSNQSDMESAFFCATYSERSSSRGPKTNNAEAQETAVTELPVPTANINRIENMLDAWSGNLKTNVVTELNKWRLTFIEQCRLEIKKEKERHTAEMATLMERIENLNEMLRAYETSIQRKDEVISNLVHGIKKEKEKLTQLRGFSEWRLLQNEAKREAFEIGVADRYYRMSLKRKAWVAWYTVIEGNWKVRVEKACQARAEEVCIRLSNDYEAKIAQLNDALEKAKAEIQRLRIERERFEDAMKKAFMRGVCALNMEAMTLFNDKDDKGEQAESASMKDEPGPGLSVQFRQQPPSSSAHRSPTPFDPTMETASDLEQMSVTRIVTSAQQKPGKTIKARLTARPDLSIKGNRVGVNVNVVGVSPPMGSVVVERHHPVTQQTLGQAVASKYPRSSYQASSSGNVKGQGQSGKTHHVLLGIQSIKVVD
ncbi:centrosomal protein POC5 isoform X1 [Latimeria chalumnae]|uniref:centrosomal protein POC5 isoform X1 n=1 Tax=Latimeria chalumnae TaxID=7897 RepID=UPI0003C19439|nr:PREDICTED: centrosomal protein POC5 isoform X1 [Latimeria chalumnae]XP_006006663.1 PREDICTED: centrosomal protein POC5 isoform X1 [Latimeria chalumnae]XP_006006664.1 PREDICTED: centrosomal protein POC5 isoform X1 [Latimeria chalumnae]|eukprot:XP_006006662.1 PREDICTED: centrosomal protein POC5 isoform X1 [Latimeria chalumnae]